MRILTSVLCFTAVFAVHASALADGPQKPPTGAVGPAKAVAPVAPAADEASSAPAPSPTPAAAEPAAPSPTRPTERAGAATATTTTAASYAGHPSESDRYEGEYQPPTIVDYYGGKVPRNSRVEDRPRTGLIATGLAISGGMYAISLIYALSTCSAQQVCRAGSDWLYAPVFGPFVTASKAPSSGGVATAIFDGALQTGGLVLAGVGLLMPKKVVVTYKDMAVRVAPTPVGAGMGVGLTITSL